MTAAEPRTSLTRAEYETICQWEADQWAGVHLEDPEALHDDLLAKGYAAAPEDYPKWTGTLCKELARRGLDCDPQTIQVFRRHNPTVIPVVDGRNYTWTLEQADQVADWLERVGLFTTWAKNCQLAGHSLFDDLAARRKAGPMVGQCAKVLMPCGWKRPGLVEVAYVPPAAVEQLFAE
jgi:hypothetical protein